MMRTATVSPPVCESPGALMQPCSVDGCPNAAKRGDLCWAHLKRRARQKPMTDPLSYKARGYSSPWEHLQRAAVRLADADSEDDAEYERRKDVLRKAALAYIRHLRSRTPEIVHTRHETVSRGEDTGQRSDDGNGDS